MSRIEVGVSARLADGVRPIASQEDSHRQQVEVASEEIKGVKAAVAGSTPNSEEVSRAAAQVAKVIEAASGRQVSFQVDEPSKQMFVEIRDRGTDEIIKQLPSEEILKLREHLDNLIGMLLDEEA